MSKQLYIRHPYRCFIKLHTIAYICLINLLLVPSLLRSQQYHSLKFESITPLDGLSDWGVNCVYNDSHGFMWFGTESGLNMYDGNSIKIFRHNHEDPGSLKDHYIESIYEDRRGQLWIGTQTGWLEKYDREQEIFDTRIFSDTPATLQEIGDRYGISRERVRQVEKNIIKKMREYFKREIPDYAAYTDHITRE